MKTQKEVLFTTEISKDYCAIPLMTSYSIHAKAPISLYYLYLITKKDDI